MDETKKDGESRRNFLKMGLTAAPAAAAAAVVGTEASAADETTPGSALKKTEHVKRYLDSAKF